MWRLGGTSQSLVLCEGLTLGWLANQAHRATVAGKQCRRQQSCRYRQRVRARRSSCSGEGSDLRLTDATHHLPGVRAQPPRSSLRRGCCAPSLYIGLAGRHRRPFGSEAEVGPQDRAFPRPCGSQPAAAASAAQRLGIANGGSAWESNPPDACLTDVSAVLKTVPGTSPGRTSDLDANPESSRRPLLIVAAVPPLRSQDTSPSRGC